MGLRLLTSLLPPRRRPKRASASAHVEWPSRRPPRWLRSLIAWQAPRGLGSAAAALLLLASVCYGVVRGNHGAAIVAEVQNLCDDAANAAGFGITEVALAGAQDVARADILRLAGVTERTSLLFLDPGETRARLMSNPWIAEATVLKLYPGRLRIEIKERKPYALWQDERRVALIAADGTVLAAVAPPRYFGLPLVVGKGAGRAADAFLAMLAHYPAIAHEVKASALIAERRWTLYLKNGIEVLLPEGEPERALRTLSELDRSKKLLARDIVKVDLRLPDRVGVRLSEAAAEARDAAFKAVDKAAKKTKKGGEA
jgi:cell division protein FtsQ